MIKLTHDAAALLTDARAASGAPDQYGVRFYVVDTPQQGQALAFDFVERPEPQDEVADQEGLPVYVAPELSNIVHDSTLDAKKTDGRAQLVLRSD